MAVSVVLTGTSQSVTATNGSASVTAASTTGWVVGATVQGTGWPAGTKIVSFVANTSGVFSNNFTGTTGTSSIIVSSNTGTVTVTLGASGDTAGPSNIISAGFGTQIGNQVIQIIGACHVVLAIATGAVYDDTEWHYELGNGASLRLNESYGCGIWRSGWKLKGSTWIKAKGHTVVAYNFGASVGGQSIFFNSGAPPGFVAGTTMPSVHWNDVGWYESGNSGNACPTPVAYYTSWSPVGLTSGRIVFDYWGDTAPNSSFAGSYGTIESLLMSYCIGGVSTGVTATSLTSIGKFEYFSFPTGGGANGPDIKMAFPNNVPFSGYAPIFYTNPASNEIVACFSSNNEILVDYIFPTGFNVITNTQNYSNGTRTYKRTVSININNSAGTALTGSTLYVYSGSNVLVNTVQAGNFSSPLQAAYLSWVGRSGNSYINALASTDTRSQIAQIRLYRYQQQTLSYSLQDSAYTQTIFMLSDTGCSAYTASQAAAISGVSINFTTQVVTVSSSVTLDQLYSYIAYQLALTTNSAQANFVSMSGTTAVFATGWNLTIGAGATLSTGTYVTALNVPTITTASALNNLTLISNVTQATPTNLTGLNLTGSLTYNTNSVASVTFTNCAISGTVSNSGTGAVSATRVNSTIGVFGSNVVDVPPSYTFTLTGLQSGSEIYIYLHGRHQHPTGFDTKQRHVFCVLTQYRSNRGYIGS